jgi:hypothetical protein
MHLPISPTDRVPSTTNDFAPNISYVWESKDTINILLYFYHNVHYHTIAIWFTWIHSHVLILFFNYFPSTTSLHFIQGALTSTESWVTELFSPNIWIGQPISHFSYYHLVFTLISYGLYISSSLIHVFTINLAYSTSL